eukprot:scaffold57559_cov54-Attheya_sp.AAC.3
MQKKIEEEWKHDMMAQHVKLRLGHYDKFEDFLKLARSIKSPFTRDYTYESLYANKVKSVQITYNSNNEFQAVPECVVNAAKVIILGLDEKSGKQKRTLDGGDGNGKKKERTLKGMFVAKRGASGPGIIQNANVQPD